MLGTGPGIVETRVLSLIVLFLEDHAEAARQSGRELWHPLDLGGPFHLPLTSSCVILGKALNLSEPQYPDLENGANTSLPGRRENFHETALYIAQAASTWESKQ